MWKIGLAKLERADGVVIQMIINASLSKLKVWRACLEICLKISVII